MKSVNDFLKEGFGSARSEEATDNLTRASIRLAKFVAIAIENSEVQGRLNPIFRTTNNRGQTSIRQARQEIKNIEENLQILKNEWNGVLD